MKTFQILVSAIFFVFAGRMNQPILCQENQRDTMQVENVSVDTVWVEKVRVDTVWVEKANEPQQIQRKADETKPQESKGRNPKVYYGGYANISVGTYTRIGFEPLIAYKLFPKFSVGTKLSYEYVKDKRYETDHESSNFGFSVFARRRFLKRLYAHRYQDCLLKCRGIMGSHPGPAFTLQNRSTLL